MIFKKCLVIGEECIIPNFLNLFQKFGQLLYSSKPAGLKCVAFYNLFQFKQIHLGLDKKIFECTYELFLHSMV